MAAYTSKRMMYHATHEDNIRSIFEHGLSVDYSQGKRRAIWFTPKNGIMAGIVHAANRHGWRVDEMVVVGVEIPLADIRYSGNEYLYYSLSTVKVENSAPARYFLLENPDDDQQVEA